MTLTLDAEVRDAIGQVLAAAAVEPPPTGDWRTRRIKSAQVAALAARALPPVTGISCDKLSLTASDGTKLPMLWYSRDDSDQPGSAALYLHGGGMIIPWLPVHDALVRAYVAASGVPMLAVDYRVAPEHPHPVPVEDCYAALVWLLEHATDLG